MERCARRRLIQWCLVPVVLITIGLGWKFPLLGFTVPVVMLAGVVGGIFRGRYVCGNLCPRGSFFDRLLAPVSMKKPIPQFLRGMTFRWLVLASLMVIMAFRVSRNPGDVKHWGHVFWLMCVVTTGIGVVLGVCIHPRAWCAFCPMGTIQNAIGGGRDELRIDRGRCHECKLCEKACPLALSIVKHKDDGLVLDRDCLKCSECIGACPAGSLRWPSTSGWPRKTA